MLQVQCISYQLYGHGGRVLGQTAEAGMRSLQRHPFVPLDLMRVDFGGDHNPRGDILSLVSYLYFFLSSQ